MLGTAALLGLWEISANRDWSHLEMARGTTNRAFPCSENDAGNPVPLCTQWYQLSRPIKKHSTHTELGLCPWVAGQVFMWAHLDLQRMLFLKISVSVAFLMATLVAHPQMFWLYQDSQESWCRNFTLSPKVTESRCYPLKVGCTPIPWLLPPAICLALSLRSKRDKGSVVLLPPDYYIIIVEAFVDVPSLINCPLLSPLLGPSVSF